MQSPSIDPIRLRVTSLTSKTIDYLRFMTGREVRARVVRGGGVEDVLQIRMGGHMLKARLSGESLPTGRDFFVRVENKEGGFRLVVLSGLNPAPGGGTPPAGPGAPPGIPAAIYRAYLAFLGSGARLPEKNSKQAGRDLSRMDPGTLRQTVQDALRSAATGGPPVDLNFGGEKIEFVLFDQWSERAEKDGFPGDFGQEGENSEDGGESEVVGFGRGEPAPATFFVRIRLPRLGTLGVLITGMDPDFQRLSIHITPLHPPTARLISERLGEWRGQLLRDLPGLEGLQILPPEQGSSASVDFTA